MATKKPYKKHPLIPDRAKLYREKECWQCKRNTMHIYCKSRLHAGMCYACMVCTVEEEETVEQH